MPIDLTLLTKHGYFNHRVAAVIVNDNKLLAQKNTKDNSYYLVGAEFASASQARTRLSVK